MDERTTRPGEELQGTPDTGDAPKKRSHHKRKPQEGRNERGQFTKGTRIGEEVRFRAENAAACKYKEEYCEMILEYFGAPATKTEYIETLNGDGEVVKRVPMTVPTEYPTYEGFAAKLGVLSDTLRNWCDISPRFKGCYERAKELQKARLVSCGLTGQYNPVFAKFVAINCHGMTDKTSTDSTVTLSVEMAREIDEESN